jgi:hypothetical protein
MTDRARRIISLMFALSLLGVGRTSYANDQTWMRNIVKWNAGETVQLWSAQECRNSGFSLYNEPFVEFLEVGIRFEPLKLKTLYGAVGYRRQWNEAGNVTVNENRWIAMVGAKTKQWRDLTIAARIRLDGKYFDREQVQDYVWYRFLLNPSYRMSPAGVEVVPHFVVELFGDTRPQSKIFINRTRLHFGMSIPLGGHFRPLIEYMRQDVHNSEQVHAIRLQLIWTI